MKKILIFSYVLLLANITLVPSLCAEEKKQMTTYTNVSAGGQNGLAPFPNNNRTRKMIIRTNLEGEGRTLAKKGLYREALIKYQEALNPDLLNHEYDKSSALGAIENIYAKEGKFKEALEIHQWFIKANPNKDFYIDKQREFESLLKAQNIKSNTPIYDHINYLKKKYKKYLPPQAFGDSMFHLTPISQIIHLYDYIGDADGAISFMNEILSTKYLDDRFERPELESVKAAFEEDKRTGQKGHLQKVIETSDYISW